MAAADDSFDQYEEEETGEAQSEAVISTCSGGRKRLFSKELRCMMYGFGDDQNPYTESVDLLEDLVIEFITQMHWLRDQLVKSQALPYFKVQL
ncbi:putative transcription initiation factor TFIID subunit 13 [Penaeus vannamei]|uniref:Transcription initiation factor TFIID subunit 13 n=1 Tax=Penaeus vannamei TaxID=6689 RepID=A0A3R7SZM4_PENVA|nr:putative transcription initiation factor TFIID subunit 13 [Penaeus vannamei]